MLTCRCARKVSHRYTVQEKINTAPKIRFSTGKSHIVSTDAHIPMATQIHPLLQRAPVPHRLASLRVPAVLQRYGSLSLFTLPSPQRRQQCHKDTLPLPYSLRAYSFLLELRHAPPSSLPARRPSGGTLETFLRTLRRGLQLKGSGLLPGRVRVVAASHALAASPEKAVDCCAYRCCAGRLVARFSGN